MLEAYRHGDGSSADTRSASPRTFAVSLSRTSYLLPPPSSLLPPPASGVDAVGGAEAILSHLVTQELRVPCAHAPALEPIDVDDEVTPADRRIDRLND